MIKKGSWKYYAIQSTNFESRMPTEMSKCEMIRRTYFCWMYWPLWLLIPILMTGALFGMAMIVIHDYLEKPILTPVSNWFNRITACPLGKVEIEQ